MSAETLLSGRRAVLTAYGFDGKRQEPEFAEIVAEVCRVTGAPVGLLGFPKGGREWIAASHGWRVGELPEASSIAARLADERDPVVIADATSDPRFSSHPLVVAEPYVRFIAAVPLVDEHVGPVGALYALDRNPRVLSPGQVYTLRLIGRQVMRDLAVRRERIATAEELSRLRDLLDESMERFRDFFEQTDDFVLSIGSDGRLMHMNETTEQTLGFSREDLVRQPLARVIDPELRAAFLEALDAAFTTRRPEHVETVFVTSSGRRITAEGMLRPRVIDGKAVLVRVIFRDITERKQYEAELGSARDAALEAARLKTQFLTNVSHEIRTPMNGIIGMIDLLNATALSPEQSDYANQARASAEQLLSIVNNILYVSSVEAGRLSTAQVDFDLYRMLHRIVEVMKIAALGKDVTISFVYDPALPPIFRGSQARVRQVVSNLLENAVKFTEQGAITLSVKQQTETPTHHVVRFEVRDTGIGIAEEDRLLLFEKFSQVEASSTRRFGGVGLGLATARQLVETMGGLIDVESTPGVGSTFWFSIPFPKHAATRRPIASSELEFKGKRVLLLDRNLTSRRTIRHYLETSWEMRVDAAESVADAGSQVRCAAPDGDPFRVVLFDSTSDAEAGALVRDLDGIATIFLGGGVHETVNEEKLRALGVAAYVAKPVGQGELFDALTIALAHEALPLARSAMEQLDSRSAPREVTPEMRGSVRVLLAEDNFLNRKLTLSQLEKLGYTADAVANGKEAVEAMAATSYDVILMDCQMPIVDGYEATMQIRKLQGDAPRRTRIIAMTANALEGDREKCLAAGMDDYLAKPTKHEDLEAALARYFEPARR